MGKGKNDASEVTVAQRKELAALLGINEQYLYQCLTGRREMGHAAAMQAELATNGRLTRQMVCTKSYASVWPELVPKQPRGRPPKKAREEE